MCAWKFSTRPFCFSTWKCSEAVMLFGGINRFAGSPPSMLIHADSTWRCFGSYPFG